MGCACGVWGVGLVQLELARRGAPVIVVRALEGGLDWGRVTFGGDTGKWLLA